MPPVPIALQLVPCPFSRLPRLVLSRVLPACRLRVRALRRRHRPRLARRLRVPLPLVPRVVRGLPELVLLALRGRRQAPAINRR